MSVLVPMRPEEFVKYRESSVTGYAKDSVEAGYWSAEGSLKRSRIIFDSLLPHGLTTPNNYLYELQAAVDGATVGFLWFANVERQGIRMAYVYHILIKEPYRRLGHAKRALFALEPIVASLGLSSIGLQVFGGNNIGAQALYRQVGYVVTGINMSKNLNASA
jgi:ribosomal protein S18 acetylase RimI-like enzyme